MRIMRHSLSIFSALLILVSFAGCRGGKELALYHPGEIESWETIETEFMKTKSEARPRVELQTTMGTVTIELFDEAAPLSVANFLQYVEESYYEGTIFHRVEPGMVVQGGGFVEDMTPKETRDPIANEAGNGLRNRRGTVGVARTMKMDTGTSQFYFNLVDNTGFNGDGIKSGYAVFGRVYDGMEVIDGMSIVETSKQAGLNNVPVEPIVILSARRIQ